MKNLKFAADYRQLRISKLRSPEFSHLLLLLFWPIYGISFFILESVWIRDYHLVYCFIDDYIPFCELFVIPYYFWFVFLVGMSLYSLLFDIGTFRKYMWYIIITYSLTILIYIIYPTAQGLRPTEFARDNIFTHIVSGLYNFDTDTNVCPSLHVIGSFAVLFAAWNDKWLSSWKKRTGFIIATVLISLSTVFLKQHSIIDVVTAVILSFACYPLVFKRNKISEKLGLFEKA